MVSHSTVAVNKRYLHMKGKTPIDESFDEARERTHRQMLSTVSHDLKTPLATIIGSLEIYTRMADKLAPEKKQMLIQSALGEAYRLDGFITNILDMAKLEGGMAKIKSERCDLTSLLHDCITRIGPRAKKANITLSATEPSTIVVTDPVMLGRAAGILLDNALKHSGKEPTITISYGCGDRGDYIRVRDNGPGIEKGKEEDIFCKYTRFSKSDQQNAGTGLGLAICRQIMNLLPGTVTVKNHPEGGAEFTLAFNSQQQ